MYFVSVVLTGGLLPLIISGHRTDLYTSYVLPENSSITDLISKYSESSPSTSHCALQCNWMEKCQGLAYDWLTKKCYHMTCLDINLFSEGQGTGYDFYVAKDARYNLSKVLARGNYSVYLKNFAIYIL